MSKRRRFLQTLGALGIAGVAGCSGDDGSDATPTAEPTDTPTEEPTDTPTEESTDTPTEEPTEEPTAEPTEEPTATPEPTEPGSDVYFPLDGDAATNEVTGTDATVEGGVSTGAEGVVGSAFEFDGEDGALVAEATSVNQEQATCSAWFTFSDHDEWSRILQAGGSPEAAPADTGGWSLEFEGDSNTLTVTTYNPKERNAALDLQPDTWYFTTLVLDGESVRWHVFDQDGELDQSPVETTQTRTATEASQLNVMAADGWNTAGRVDEIRGQNRALSASEVEQLYQDSGSSPRQGNLVTYLPLDGDAATDEATGTDATVEGGVSTGAEGVVGSAFEFDGDDGAMVAEGTPLNRERVTVTSWFNFSGHDEWSRILQAGGSPEAAPADTGGWSLEFEGDSNTLTVTTYNPKERNAALDLEADTWYFSALVLDGESVRWHVFDGDGELDESPVETTQTRTVTRESPLNVMAADGWNTAGRVDEIRGYAYPLSSEAVTQLYDGVTQG